MAAGIKYSKESIEGLFRDGSHYFKQHHDEVGHFQSFDTDPQLSRYKILQDYNALRVFVARKKDGELVGYSTYFVDEAYHHPGVMHAKQDTLYIRPDVRGFGFDFVNWIDNQLRDEGIKAVYHYVKPEHDFSPLLMKSGYRLVEHVYAREL